MAEEMRWLFSIPKPRALLVVAHPDDETVFAGGLVLQSTHTEWTIISCTHKGTDREREFRYACTELSEASGNPIRAVTLDQTDGEIDSGSLREQLRSRRGDYDIVITHNRMGEYEGEDPRRRHDHESVHEAVIEGIANPNTWVFICPAASNVDQCPLRSKRPGATAKVEVPTGLRETKKRIFRECHQSQRNVENGDLRPIFQWYLHCQGTEEYSFHK